MAGRLREVLALTAAKQLAQLRVLRGCCQYARWRRRLAPLLTSCPPRARPASRDEAVVHVAHAAVWAARGKVYGGFVRDYVCGGRPASDVDVDVADYDAAERAMTSALASHGIKPSQPSQPWGQERMYRRLYYASERGDRVEVSAKDHHHHPPARLEPRL